MKQVTGKGVVNRRGFMVRAGVNAIVGAVAASCRNRHAIESNGRNQWDEVRAQFNLVHDQIDLSALFIASHPKPVREAIERYRATLDESPTSYLREQLNDRENEVLKAAADYLGATRTEIALTDSTTMGLGLVYNGLKLQPGQQIVTTLHDYYATHESLRMAAERSGAQIREIQLYQWLQTVTTDEIVNNITSATYRFVSTFITSPAHRTASIGPTHLNDWNTA